MNDKTLANVRVAILATNGFEQSEMTEPRQALKEAGANTVLIAPKAGKLQAMKHDTKADYFDVDLTLDKADVADFDAVLLPGGALNADALRAESKAKEFVQDIDKADRRNLSRLLVVGFSRACQGTYAHELSHHPGRYS